MRKPIKMNDGNWKERAKKIGFKQKNDFELNVNRLNKTMLVNIQLNEHIVIY